MAKPTFYTAFSNSVSNIIPNLSDEAMKISDLLQELAFNDKLYYIKDEIFGVDRLIQNFAKYGRRIDIFYFSGHGKDGCLQLTENFKLKQGQMSSLVNNSLRNAKMIFFNACETFQLAQEIIENRKPGDDNTVLISCRSAINSIIAERFATLLFTQVGQPGTYREAYDQAKSLLQVMHNDLRFREFDTKDAIKAAGDDFDIGYIEIDPTCGLSPEAAASYVAPEPTTAPGKSIIGSDKLTRDALTTNYVHEVIESIVAHPQQVGTDKLSLLTDALQTAQQIALGEKKDRQASILFRKAADALPGLASPAAFESLISTEKNLNNPYVKSLIKSRDTDPALGALVDKVAGVQR